MSELYKIHSLGENALTVDFGNVISIENNVKVTRLFEYFEREKFAGIRELFPAYSSLTVFYDVVHLRKLYPHFATAFDVVANVVANFVENAVTENFESQNNSPRTHEIPVNFDEEFAPDLAFVAEINDLSPPEVIEIFTGETYRVFMLGFLPGFAYLGEISERIAAPRKDSPRLKVPAGSVAVAGRQTGIYPFDSPGGWQIIGKTDVIMFDPAANPPAFFQAGDFVKFCQI